MTSTTLTQHQPGFHNAPTLPYPVPRVSEPVHQTVFGAAQRMPALIKNPTQLGHEGDGALFENTVPDIRAVNAWGEPRHNPGQPLVHARGWADRESNAATVYDQAVQPHTLSTYAGHAVLTGHRR